MSDKVVCDTGRRAALPHRPRGPLPVRGGTTFTFVTDGIGERLVDGVPPLRPRIVDARSASPVTHRVLR